MLWVTLLIGLLLLKRTTGSIVRILCSTTPVTVYTGDRGVSQVFPTRPSRNRCAEDLLCRYPLAGNVCCRLSEEDDQLQEISRLHMIAQTSRHSNWIIQRSDNVRGR